MGCVVEMGLLLPICYHLFVFMVMGFTLVGGGAACSLLSVYDGKAARWRACPPQGEYA